MPIDNHTPGPWLIDSRTDALHMMGNSIGLTPAYVALGEAPYEEAKANLRLIAAAPDLLRELRTAADTICYLKPECYDNAEHEAEFNKKLNGIYAAIAKAQGGA